MDAIDDKIISAVDDYRIPDRPFAKAITTSPTLSIIAGNHSTIDVQVSADVSTIDDDGVFNDLKKLLLSSTAKTRSVEELDEIITKLDELALQHEKTGYLNTKTYVEFMNMVASHMTVLGPIIGPLLGRLSNFLPSG